MQGNQKHPFSFDSYFLETYPIYIGLYISYLMRKDMGRFTLVTEVHVKIAHIQGLKSWIGAAE